MAQGPQTQVWYASHAETRSNAQLGLRLDADTAILVMDSKKPSRRMGLLTAAQSSWVPKRFPHALGYGIFAGL